MPEKQKPVKPLQQKTLRKKKNLGRGQGRRK
jgi:hypothetical protein